MSVAWLGSAPCDSNSSTSDALSFSTSGSTYSPRHTNTGESAKGNEVRSQGWSQLSLRSAAHVVAGAGRCHAVNRRVVCPGVNLTNHRAQTKPRASTRPQKKKLTPKCHFKVLALNTMARRFAANDMPSRPPPTPRRTAAMSGVLPLRSPSFTRAPSSATTQGTDQSREKDR